MSLPNNKEDAGMYVEKFRRRKLCLKYYVLPEHCLVNPIIEIINKIGRAHV